MEKRIRKILKKYDITMYNWKLEIAKEITDLIQSEYVEKEFMIWFNNHYNESDESGDKIYDYWLKEVKGVKQ